MTGDIHPGRGLIDMKHPPSLTFVRVLFLFAPARVMFLEV